jgi:hypothetical protein
VGSQSPEVVLQRMPSPQSSSVHARWQTDDGSSLVHVQGAENSTQTKPAAQSPDFSHWRSGAMQIPQPCTDSPGARHCSAAEQSFGPRHCFVPSGGAT